MDRVWYWNYSFHGAFLVIFHVLSGTLTCASDEPFQLSANPSFSLTATAMRCTPPGIKPNPQNVPDLFDRKACAA